MSLPKASDLQPNPLPEEQRTTPDGLCRGITSNVLCVQYNQEVIKLKLSVQMEFNLGSGILRGYQDYAGRLMMDHTIGPRGKLLFGKDMRIGTISVWEHQIRHLSECPNSKERIIAVVGNGNLTQNPYFVAWFGRNGLLVRLRNEPVTDREYDCIVIHEDNSVTVEILRFENNAYTADETGWRAINVSTGKSLPDSTQVAFSGQRIVTNGQALSRQDLEAQVLSGLFYDLRQVFRFPAIKKGDYWRDLALEQFYTHGSINRDNVVKALKGEPIATRWRDLTDDAKVVKKALQGKGFRVSPNRERDTYILPSDSVDIVFSDAIYCHNLLGIDKEGNLCSVQVTGWGNNVGATLEGLSLLAASVFQNAILLDNGGDVFYLVNHDPNERMIPYNRLGDRNWTVVPSCENRYFIRSVLLFTVDGPLEDNDIRAVKPEFKI